MTNEEALLLMKLDHQRINHTVYPEAYTVEFVWGKAYMDMLWGATPGCHLSIVFKREDGTEIDRVVERVYPHKRLKTKLEKEWVPEWEKQRASRRTKT